MNINGITGASRTNPYSTNSKAKVSSSFGDMLSQTAAFAKTPDCSLPKSRTLTEAAGEAISNAPPCAIQVFLPNDKTVCSHGFGTDQYIYAEYTEDSTTEDPIVRIYCRAKSGTYEYTCHLNDVDPENASYAELAALYGHQVRSGERAPISPLGAAVPTGYEIGDMMSRQNFLLGLEAMLHSKTFSQADSILMDVAEYLKYYAGLVEEKKQQFEEVAEFEALMNAVDSVIEDKAVAVSSESV